MEPANKKFKTIPSQKSDWKHPDWYRSCKDTVGHLVGELPVGQFKIH